MYRTLSQLKESVERLIEQQGEDAPVAAFIFSKNDVIYYTDGDDGFPDLNEEKFLNDEDTDDVLIELGGCDYIYEQVNEIIEDEVKRVRNKVAS